MSDSLLQKLSTVDLATLVALIVLVSIAVKVVTPWLTKLKDYIIKNYKRETKNETYKKMIEEDHTRIGKYEQNRINDREQSFQIQKELTDAIKAINDRLDELTKTTEERFRESREREDKRARAELKDKIGQSYRLYHSRGQWTHMEQEALEDLIAEYEAAGGVNSFVHSKVAKEMYTWRLVEEDIVYLSEQH